MAAGDKLVSSTGVLEWVGGTRQTWDGSETDNFHDELYLSTDADAVPECVLLIQADSVLPVLSEIHLTGGLAPLSGGLG